MTSAPLPSSAPAPLPIDAYLPRIAERALIDGSLVVRAEPGAGKTTRVPPALLDRLGAERPSRNQVVLVAEPRRLAARLAAARVAEERGGPLGGEVGYEVRLDRRASAATRLLYVTDGVLLQRLRRDPTLADVGAVVLDEVHERRLEGDGILALALALRRGKRPDLALVAVSATLDAERLAAHLGAEVIDVPGRVFPVEVRYRPFGADVRLEDRTAFALQDLLDEAPLAGGAAAVEGGRAAVRADSGDVLVFLPGQGEIARCEQAIAGIARSRGREVARLHGSLPPAEQDRALRPSGPPRVILATNVAETSITAPRVTAVIDTGLHREAGHDPWTGLASLALRPISRASAAQRAGRAGRVAPGVCVRLYSAADLAGRPEHQAPEILRADLADLWLSALAAKAPDPAALPWLDPPPAAAAASARALLTRLGAIGPQGTDAAGGASGASVEDGTVKGGAVADGAVALTPTGLAMARLPVHPRHARILLEAARLGIPREGALAVAALAAGPREGARDLQARGGRAVVDRDEPSDVLVRMDAIERAGRGGRRGRGGGRSEHGGGEAWTHEAALLADRLERSLGRVDRSAPADHAERALLQALLAGYPDRVARRREPGGDRFLLCEGGGARLAPTSVVRSAPFAILLEAERRGAGDALATLASAIEPDWLCERFPDEVVPDVAVLWNEARERVEASQRLCYGALALVEEPLRAGERAREVEAELHRQAARRGAAAFAPAGALDALVRRVAFARTLAPDLPAIDAAVIDAALAALCEGLSSFAELRAAGLVERLRASHLGERSALLDRLAPESVTLPGSRRVFVHYELDRAPWVESRLQDFFGLREGPCIGGGRVPLVLHLLAPNRRAVQVTTDLAGFWERHYPKLARELRRRYPRHAWPDDPLAAAPPAPGRNR